MKKSDPTCGHGQSVFLSCDLCGRIVTDAKTGERLYQNPPLFPEICVCAAIKFRDKIFRGNRHGDCFYSASRAGIDCRKDEGEQGFVTSTGRFVTREEGRKLQDAAGIKSADPNGYTANTLFSEDLY